MKNKTNSNYSNKKHNSKIKTNSTSKCSKAKRTNKEKSKSNPMMILILIKRNSEPHSKLKITILSNSKSLSFKKYISPYPENSQTSSRPPFTINLIKTQHTYSLPLLRIRT
jgi:hypothetical protein